MLQKQTVTAETLALIKRLMADPRLNDFTLVGGTALALTIGHRQSIDIDLFIDRSFDSEKVAGILAAEYQAEFLKISRGSVSGFIDGVKIDLIAHPYTVVQPTSTIDGIRIMSLEDIAAMKLHAIVNNGTRLKDFIDIHFLLEKMPLQAMYDAYEIKYHPDASRGVARLALRDHNGINFQEPVMLLASNFEWAKIDARLLKAVEYPSRIFEAKKQSQSVIKKPEPKLRRGRRI